MPVKSSSKLRELLKRVIARDAALNDPRKDGTGTDSKCPDGADYNELYADVILFLQEELKEREEKEEQEEIKEETYDVFTVVRIRIKDRNQERAEKTALQLIENSQGDWLDCGAVVETGVEMTEENPVSKAVKEVEK